MMRAVPPPPEAEPPSLRRIARGLRYAAARAGADRAPTSSTSWRCSSACRWRSSPPWPPSLGGAGRARPALRRARRRARCCATVTSGWTARVHRHGARGLRRGRGLGRRHRRLRPRAEPGAGAARPRRRGRRRHAVGHLPRHDLEPDDPRPPARPAGGHRAGQLLDRAAARQRRVRRRRLARRRARVDRLRRRAVRRRRARRGARAAGVLALRHRRE